LHACAKTMLAQALPFIEFAIYVHERIIAKCLSTVPGSNP
jgi:hypothetical protein